MLALFSHLVFVDIETLSLEALVSRKWARAHLGKPSYKDRGVSEAEYRVYFEGSLPLPLPLPLPLSLSLSLSLSRSLARGLSLSQREREKEGESACARERKSEGGRPRARERGDSNMCTHTHTYAYLFKHIHTYICMHTCSDTSDLLSKNTGSRKTFKQVTHTHTHGPRSTSRILARILSLFRSLSHTHRYTHTRHTQIRDDTGGCGISNGRRRPLNQLCPGPLAPPTVIPRTHFSPAAAVN